MTLIQANNISIAYGDRVVLRNVTLSVARGEIITIVGPNGTGKSSLVRVLTGSMPPSQGEVHRKDGLRIGYVPQRWDIDRTLPLSLRRFLGLAHKFEPSELAAAARRLGVENELDSQIGALSGGQFQRALLTRAILGKPDVLVLDEPTQGLDQPGTATFYRLLESLRSEMNCSILLVSHDLHVVMSASDRVICLNGHVCCEGTPQVVQEAPEYRALFGHGTGGTMALYRHDHDHAHHAHD